jgi:hypothetical protein
MTSRHKKIYTSFRPKSSDAFEFRESHPAFKFNHLSKLKHLTIPRIALPPNKLCSLEELGLQQANLTKKHTTNGKFMPKWPL